MSFQIHALPYEPFAASFELAPEALAARNSVVQTVTESPGTPCRVSLKDAKVGERVLLTGYCHQPAASPYRAEHAIFVRQGAVQAHPAPGEVPPVLRRRLISVRLFDQFHMMFDAQVIDGKCLSDFLTLAFRRHETAYIHLHNAAPGCFAAGVSRA